VDTARLYLLEAARAMTDLAKEAQGDELRAGRQDIATRLLELARDCEKAKKENRRTPGLSEAKGRMEASSESESTDGADKWIVKEKPNLRFDDVAGLDDVKEDIRLKMIYPVRAPGARAEIRHRARRRGAALRPAGHGKTMLAKATAGEIDATFFRISAADVLSKWVGEAEQNLKKLFDAAAAESRAIIFIDEIESLIPARRDEGSASCSAWSRRSFKAWKASTRSKARRSCSWARPTSPGSSTRPSCGPGRFDEKVYIPLPDLAARRKMLDIYLSKRPLAEGH
jgi:transitional endoplasmic reticulum ATPase